jgi:hypothetical protein
MEQHTLEYDGATFTFANTMHAMLRFRIMVGRLDLRMVEGKEVEYYVPGRFTHQDMPDYDVRREFCWVMAHLESVDGWDGWKIPRETDTDKQFEACLNAFADRVDWETFQRTFVPFVNDMKRSKVGVIEEPDEELSEAERSDPK